MKRIKKIIVFIVAVLAMVSVVYAAETITIIFDPNGGTVGTNSRDIEAGTSLSDENTPTSPGRNFIGWSYDANSDYTIRLREMKATDNITLYAQWRNENEEDYIVTLDANGGQFVYSPRAYVYNRKGTTMDEPSEPTRDGYSFVGWSNSSDSTLEIDINTTSTDATYYAIWEAGNTKPDTEKVTVTFDSAGGSSINPVQIDKGTKVEKPTDPTYEGKHFLGWFLDNEAFDFNISVRQDITLVAHWENVTSKNVIVTFIAGDENYGSTFADGAYVHSANVTDMSQVANQETPIPTRWKTFHVWSTTKPLNFGDSGVTIYDPAADITGDITLYASYSDSDNSDKFAEVVFDANGGHWTRDNTDYDTKKVSVEKNTKVAKPDNPRWGNRKFDGWYTTDDEEPDEDDKWDFKDTVVEDITLYAKWSEKEDTAETDSENTQGLTPTTNVPQNFPNPENLPVVDPIATEDSDTGAISIKDIPTTGVPYMPYGVIPAAVMLCTLIYLIIRKKRGEQL